jgi:hypothetical protein
VSTYAATAAAKDPSDTDAKKVAKAAKDAAETAATDKAIADKASV